MDDTLLAGLPRIVRVAEEVRMRGWTCIVVAGAAAVYWLTRWLLGQPTRGAVTWLAALGVGVVVGVIGIVVSSRRQREALGHLEPPPSQVVYETRAHARERRTRASGVLFLAAVVFLVFDRLTNGHGELAGLIVGLLGPLGLVDLLEARGWDLAERSRLSRLYTVVRPRALIAPYGNVPVYEVPIGRPDGRANGQPTGVGRRGFGED